MAETTTLEGDAARALREAARRAGYSDVAKYVISLAPKPQATEPTPEERRQKAERFIERMQALQPHLLMSSDALMEMTRGKDWKSAVPFEDDDDEAQRA